MRICPLCQQQLHGHMAIEPELNTLLQSKHFSFVSLNYHGPFKAVLLYRDGDGGYWTKESVIEQTANQEQADNAHLTNFREALA